MRRELTLIALALGTFFMASAQCVDKFPYTYDFENFDSLQTTSSCDLTVKGDTSDGWLQDLTDDGDWRADSAGTPSLGTGPGSTVATTGNGTGTDYSPGTTSGTYLYAESSVPCVGSVVSLLSPCFDFSGTSSYQLEFAYHMFGASMGSLSVDVYDGTKWVNDVWKLSGSQDTAWQIAKVGLANFSASSVQLRFRAVTGSSWRSDVALDAIKIDTYTPLDYDGLIFESSVRRNENGYNLVPKGHINDSISYSVEIRNDGIKSITGVKLYGEVKSQKDTVTVGTMTAGSRQSFVSEFLYWPKDGDEELEIDLVLNETDGNTSNNKVSLKTGLNDTVFSRDDGKFLNGVGYDAGTVEIGNVYELFQDDTMTSGSFFIAGGPAGDSVRMHLYDHSNGVVGSRLASSSPITIDGTERWYTTKLGCDQALSKGQYLLVVEQMVSMSNMALGYNQDFFEPNVCKSNLGAWPQLELAGGVGIVALIRMNLGETKDPQITVDLSDSICENQQYVVTAEGAETYSWEPFGPVKAKTGDVVRVQTDTSFTLKVTGTDKCGKVGVLEQPIVVRRVPQLELINDTTVCEKASVTLAANTSNDYRWVNGPSNGNYTVSPANTTTYTAIADSSNGCSVEKSVSVTISKPVAMVSNDTTLCEAQPLRLEASGGVSYQWTGGASTSIYDVNPTQNTTYIVEVTDAFNCTDMDSVEVMVTKGPDLMTSADTAVCFGSRAQLRASGADSYEWEGGPTTANYNALPISTKTYFVKGFAANGCFIVDSILVSVAKIPSLELRNDTLICEGVSLDITAKTDDIVDYDWSTGETSATITATPNVTTTYKVSIANSTGCASEDSVKISVDPLPTLDFNFSQAHKNITILNYSDHGDSHLWKFGDGDSSTSQSTTHRYRVHGSYTLSYKITNKCGSIDTTFIVDVENLGVNTLDLESFSLYPNPATTHLVLSFTNGDRGLVESVIFDNTGKQVRIASADKLGEQYSQTLDVNGLPQGVYVLIVSTESGTMAHRIVIE